MHWGEITITPFEFAMITRLPFSESEVLLEDSLKWGSYEALELLGPIVRRFPPDDNQCIVKRILPGVSMVGATAEQKVRLFLLVLICRMIILDRSSRVMTRYLGELIYLWYVSEYRWGSVAYSHLLLEMKAPSMTAFGDPIVVAAL